MIPYYLFYSFLLIISLFDLAKKDIKSKLKFEKILFYLLWFLLIFFIGFRYKLANDWYAYEGIVHSIEPIADVIQINAPNFYTKTYIEPGFRLLISIINSFFDPLGFSLQALTATVSIFCYTVIISFVRKNDTIRYKFIFLSIFIALTMFREFDILRQSIAFYTFLISLRYYNSSFYKYVFLNLIGALFHISALVFIPLYFVIRIKFRPYSIFILLITYIYTLFFHFSFISILIEKLSVFYPELVFIQKLYNTSIMVENASSFSIVGLIYSLFLIVILLNYKKIQFNDQYVRLFINMFFIFILINILFSDSREIADRVSYFFYIGIAFVFVYSIQLIPKTFLPLYVLLLLAFPFIRLSRVMANPATSIVNTPYRNYFFKTQQDDDEILKNRLDKDLY